MTKTNKLNRGPKLQLVLNLSCPEDKARSVMAVEVECLQQKVAQVIALKPHIPSTREQPSLTYLLTIVAAMLCMAQSIVSMESKATISSINRNSYRRIVPARVEKANKPCSSRVEARVASAVVVHSLYHQAQKGRRPFSNSHLRIRRSKSTRNLKQVNNETRLK